MGVKHFWIYLRNTFPNNIRSINLSNVNLSSNDINIPQIDNLMLDLNGIFHNSAQKIYSYGNYKKPKSLLSKAKINRKEKNLELYKDITNRIDDIVNLIKPSKRIILCTDGTAPLSKQNQQRQRRFRSALEKDEEEFKTFDSNCISPSTNFMFFLGKYIEWYIYTNICSNLLWKDLEIIYSSDKSPGEGEAKCYNYTRYHGNKSESYIIFGNDADLIMLSLCTHIEKFYVLREDMYDKDNDYFIVDIGLLSKDISKEMYWGEEQEFISENAITDFVFLCFIVGNDFLPNIPSIEILQGGIDLMLTVYKNTCNITGHITRKIDNKTIFNNKSLALFLKMISQYEKELLETKYKKKHAFFPDDLLEKHMKLNADKSGFILDLENYKKEYYTQKMEIKEEELENACYKYLEGMQWVLSYYTRGVPNWKWLFPYYYAPFASTLHKYVEKFICPVYNATLPIDPFLQLLCILPPKSNYLIPEPLKCLMNHPKLKKYYPDKFHIDISGKRKEWEGIVILPILDLEILTSIYKTKINTMNNKDLSRNKLYKSTIYEYNDFQHYYKSPYGDIPTCNVKYRYIDL